MLAQILRILDLRISKVGPESMFHRILNMTNLRPWPFSKTIFSLAKKYYGSKSYWTVIAQYNKNKISDPSDVKAGMKIKLPKIVK